MGTSPTIMSLLLNCQWFKCVCDFINKNNGIIGLIIIILLCFGLYKMKNKTSDIKLRVIVLLNIFALAFSVMALCMTHPNQLGFDYIGAIVGILALLVTILIGWNIFYAIHNKEKIKSEIRKDVDKMIDEIRNDMNRHFILEEMTFATSYAHTKEWDKVLPLFSNMAKRFIQIAKFNNKDIDIAGFASSVSWMVNELSKHDYVHYGSELAGFMELFNNLWKYDKRITEIYNQYKENDSKYRKPAQMSGISNDCEKKSIKYVVAICQFTNLEYFTMKDADSLSKAKYPFKMGNLKDAHLFDSQEQALDEYRRYTDIKGARPIIVPVIIDENEMKDE